VSAVRVGDRVRVRAWAPERSARVLALAGELARVELPELDQFGIEWWVMIRELTVVEREPLVSRLWVGIGNGLLLTTLSGVVGYYAWLLLTRLW